MCETRQQLFQQTYGPLTQLNYHLRKQQIAEQCVQPFLQVVGKGEKDEKDSLVIISNCGLLSTNQGQLETAGIFKGFVVDAFHLLALKASLPHSSMLMSAATVCAIQFSA